MKHLCALCKNSFVDEQTTRSVKSITKGVCAVCEGKFTLSSSAADLKALVDVMDVPLLVLQAEPRLVYTANKRALELFSKERDQVEQHRGGQIFDCAYAFTEAGCGKDAQCLQCVIKNAIVDTLMTGRSSTDVSALLEAGKNGASGAYHLRIATEKLGEMALVRVDAYQRKGEGETSLNGIHDGFSVEITGTDKHCPAGEEAGDRYMKNGNIPVLSCEGACIRGEIARLAAHLVAKEGPFRRGCHGELLTVPGSALAKWMTAAERIVLIDGCFLHCHGRVLENLIAKEKLAQFDALSYYRKYSENFDIDEVPEADRKSAARLVADAVLAELRKTPGRSLPAGSGCGTAATVKPQGCGCT